MDFEAVCRENFAHVYRFLPSLCRDAHLAEELTQDTFDRAFRKGEQFNGRCELKTWLCSIARNAYLSECRRARRPAPPAEAALDVDPDDRDGVLRIHRALHTTWRSRTRRSSPCGPWASCATARSARSLAGAKTGRA